MISIFRPRCCAADGMGAQFVYALASPTSNANHPYSLRGSRPPREVCNARKRFCCPRSWSSLDGGAVLTASTSA